MSVRSQRHRLSLAHVNTKTKVLMSVVVPLILTFAIGAVALINLDRLKTSQSLVDFSQRGLTDTARIVYNASNMEAGMRGYLLAGQETFLEPYEIGKSAVFERLAQMRERVSDDTAQVARLQQAEDILREWQRAVAEPQINLRRAIGNAATMNDMSDAVRRDEAGTYFNKVRDLLRTLITQEKDDLAKSQALFSQLLSSGISSEASTRSALQRISDTNAVISVSKDVLAAALNMEAGILGFLIAGDDEFLAQYTQNYSVFSSLIGELRETMGESTEQRALLDETEATIEQWLEDVVAPQLSLRREIGDAETMDDMADLVGQARGEQYFAQFEAVMDAFSTVEEELMATRRAQNDSTRAMTQTTIWAALVGSLVIGVSFALFVGGSIGNAVTGLTTLMQRLADGDNELVITGQDRGDEVGAMARATEIFKQNAIKVANLNQERDAANRREVELSAQRETDAQQRMEELQGLVAEITSSGNTLASSSADLRDTSDALSRQAEQNAASLEETSSALEELSGSIKLVSSNVTEASENAQTARDTAQSSERVAADAAASMQSIADASKDITRVVHVIDDIAFQINLLALNAGVEAARAGEAGRGFSIVASEVRQLAQRASDASEEIALVIAKSDAAVSEGVDKVAGAQASLVSISESVIRISTVVDEISVAISDQVNGIAEIAAAVGQIDQNTQKQAMSFENVTAASAVLASEASNLKASTARFGTEQTSTVVPMKKPVSDPVEYPVSAPKIVAAGGGGLASDQDWEEF